MQKEGRLSEPLTSADPSSQEFADLLREIEKEAIPEKLLELARKLQNALAEQSSRREKHAPDSGS